jgi:hypothetical protein
LNEKSEEVMLMYDMNRNLFWSHSVHYKKLFECNQLLPIFFWRTKLWRNKQEVEGYLSTKKWIKISDTKQSTVINAIKSYWANHVNTMIYNDQKNQKRCPTFLAKKKVPKL